MVEPLVPTLKSLYKDFKACVRENCAYAELFDTSRGVRQGCVASPWLFIIFIVDCLLDLKENYRGLKIGETLVNCLLYVDDQVLLTSSACELQDMVSLMYEFLIRKEFY